MNPHDSTNISTGISTGLSAGDDPSTRAAVMDTAYGPVQIHALAWAGEQPYVALRHPQPAPVARVRVQAQCLTSTAFAAQMCDCARQISAGVRLAATRPGTVLIYLPQEGRGHGLLSKVEVMAAMNTGLTLAGAQQATGRPENRLTYHRVPQILRHLGHLEPIVLLSDSEEKIRAVRGAGVQITSTEPLTDPMLTEPPPTELPLTKPLST